VRNNQSTTEEEFALPGFFEGRRFARATTGLLVAVAIPLASCGGGSSGGVDGVRQTMHQFVNDLIDGNYSGACGLLTNAAKAGIGGSQCAQKLALAMSLSGSHVKDTMRRQARKIDHWPVSVHGSTATVHNANGSTTHFVKSGGRWLIGSGGLTTQ
jgi:glucose-6-phosphate isomerase